MLRLQCSLYYIKTKLTKRYFFGGSTTMGSSGSQRLTFLFKYIEETCALLPIIKFAVSIFILFLITLQSNIK
jgi:hypothetical protein